MSLTVSTVDYHTGGEPFRIISGGVGPIPGKTILEKRRFAMSNLDRFRQLVVHEPRGHADMYGCFVTEPEDDGADLGVIFFHNDGYSTACGHGTIALVTWALETGAVKSQGASTTVTVDAPSGRLETTARAVGDKVASVRFRNVPSFVFANDLEVQTSRGPVLVDIAYGGAFFASVSAQELGLAVEPKHLPDLIALGREIKAAIEGGQSVVHPMEPELRDVYGVMFVEDISEDDQTLHQRNVTIFANGEVDRSPCGSGTSARLAVLDASGRLPRWKTLRHSSIVGSEFKASVVGDENIADFEAVITEVEGSAFVTGYHHFVLDPDDSMGTGFLLR